jgi:hypothetical protein
MNLFSQSSSNAAGTKFWIHSALPARGLNAQPQSGTFQHRSDRFNVTIASVLRPLERDICAASVRATRLRSREA